MIRNVVGSVLALVGATAAVWSPFRAWYDGRHGRDYRIGDLFSGITETRAGVIGSILLPFAVAALLAVVGVVLRSRVLVAVAGVVVLGFTVLWMVRVGQAEGSLVVSGDGRGLGDGVANAVGGGILLLLGALVMAGRRKDHRQARTRRDEQPPARPQDTGPVTAETRDGHDGYDGRGGYDAETRSMPYAAPGRFDVPADPPRDRDGRDDRPTG